MSQLVDDHKSKQSTLDNHTHCIFGFLFILVCVFVFFACLLCMYSRQFSLAPNRFADKVYFVATIINMIGYYAADFAYTSNLDLQERGSAWDINQITSQISHIASAGVKHFYSSMIYTDIGLSPKEGHFNCGLLWCVTNDDLPSDRCLLAIIWKKYIREKKGNWHLPRTKTNRAKGQLTKGGVYLLGETRYHTTGDACLGDAN